ncbi:MAG: TolB family protein [Vicinamibacterales bacterium]
MTRTTLSTRLVAATLAGVIALQYDAAPAAQQAGGVSQLVWFDRAGTRLGVVGGPGDYGNLELSPDGRRVAVATLDASAGTRDLWVHDTESGARTRLTATPADENWLVWSPDGARVVFNAFAQTLDLFESRPTPDAPRRQLLSGATGVWPVSWSPDGQYLLVVTDHPVTGNDIWTLPLDTTREPTPLLQTRAAENWAAFSPDGRWIAFSASITGRSEVYVMRFPDTGRRWAISTGGGSAARWRRDGRELYFIAPDRSLMAAAVTLGQDDVTADAPVPLFDTRFPYPPYHSFDVAPDGERFLVNTIVVSPRAPAVVARR